MAPPSGQLQRSMQRDSFAIRDGFTKKTKDGERAVLIDIGEPRTSTTDSSPELTPATAKSMLQELTVGVLGSVDEDERDPSSSGMDPAVGSAGEPRVLSPDSDENSKGDRKVQFSKAHFYEHSIIVGDNPACSGGPPLTIGWDCIRETVSEAYEEETGATVNTTSEKTSGQPQQKKQQRRRSYVEMRVPADIREAILRNQGYSRKDLVRLCKPVNIARAQRLRTIETMSMAPLQDIFQRVRKGIRKAILMTHQEREHRQRLKQWRHPDAKLLEEAALSRRKLYMDQKQGQKTAVMDASQTTRASTQVGEEEDASWPDV